MTRRKSKYSMATLSVQDYLEYFLLKADSSESKQDHKEKATQQSLLIATVYKSEECVENVIYSKKLIGGKHADPISHFVHDMTGNKGGISNGGNLIRTSSLLDINGESESQLPSHCSITIEILASRSPSKIGAEELLRLLDYCKRNSIKVGIHFTFSHPFSWDNKYNKEGIQQLHDRGIKLKPLSFQQGLNTMINDLNDTLESLDELQTCRGTININYHMLRRAVGKFRDALTIKSDFYFQDNDEQLQEILGYRNGLPNYAKKRRDDPASFSLLTYRDFFLLQNTEEIWAKLKVSLTKVNHGVTQEEPLFETIFNAPEPKGDKRSKHSNPGKNPLDKQSLSDLTENLWKSIGNNVTLDELASQDEIVINLSTAISEYPDRLGWQDSLSALHRHLAEKLSNIGMSNVKVESTVRYAMNLSNGQSSNTSGRSTPSTSHSSKVDRGINVECMHIQDILFDMLEDLEDNLKHLATIDYGRGANLRVDKSAVSFAMDLLNKATTIRAMNDDLHPMNSDFIDEYSSAMNRA